MKRFTIIGLAAIGFSVSLLALPEDFRIEKNPTTPAQPLKLKFWGNPNVYYVIESTTDLRTAWDQYFYAVKGVAGSGGIGQAEAVQFAPFAGADDAFFKLVLESDPFSLLGRLDHDRDGIATALELDDLMNATSAEAFVDSEPDGLPDYWEIFYFGTLSRDGTGDFDGDGVLDFDEWAARTNPINSAWDVAYWDDGDGDFLSTGVELWLKTSLNSPHSLDVAAVTDTQITPTSSDVVIVVGHTIMEISEGGASSDLQINDFR